MDRPPYHPLHYTPVTDGAKWNSIFSARVRYLATLAQRANSRLYGRAATAEFFFPKFDFLPG